MRDGPEKWQFKKAELGKRKTFSTSGEENSFILNCDEIYLKVSIEGRIVDEAPSTGQNKVALPPLPAHQRPAGLLVEGALLQRNGPALAIDHQRPVLHAQAARVPTPPSVWAASFVRF